MAYLPGAAGAPRGPESLPDPIITVEGLTKHYTQEVALAGVSFRVPRGAFFGCFGPNGAGKSTLLKILTGQLEPTAGSAQVLGYTPGRQTLLLKHGVGIVPESESPPSFLTGIEYLEFVCRLRGIEDAAGRVEQWLEFFDLTEKKDTVCKDMSKGMRQKVMLASAFIHRPPLLFVDEPFINLDPIYQRRVRDWLSDYVKAGGSVFMCSHILEIAEKVCTDVLVLDRGRVLAGGPIASFRGNGLDLSDVFLDLIETKGGAARAR
ncbi:MAG TPA: ABC transporter ATP-binding protein [Candidatus Thermoplasmatota archaeon]